MSTLINAARAGARTRVPRFAEAAVERARLTVVPPRRSIGRTQAARTPFAVLVIAMLATGVVGLLMFNTNMQQSSFQATKLQDQLNGAVQKQQSLNIELEKLRDPQNLAAEAKHRLGMVAPPQPAFVRLSDGRVLGKPTPATVADSVRINALPSRLPAAIRQRTVIVKLKPTSVGRRPTRASMPASAPMASRASRSSLADTRGASVADQGAGGRKKASTNQTDSGATP